MRKTSQQLMLLAYFGPTEADVSWVELTNIDLLLPELSGAGIRSLIYWLQQRQLVSLARFDGRQHLSLTGYGEKALESEFPALNREWADWSGEWQEIVFLTPPRSDKQFRYLRNLLLKHQALALTRGVYLLPRPLYSAVADVLDRLYQQSTTTLTITKKAVDQLRPIIIKNYDLIELYNSYSSISTQLNGLLHRFSTKKRLTKKERVVFKHLFDQYCLNLSQDAGLGPFYLPNFPQVMGLLNQLQQVYSLLSYDKNIKTNQK